MPKNRKSRIGRIALAAAVLSMPFLALIGMVVMYAIVWLSAQPYQLLSGLHMFH